MNDFSQITQFGNTLSNLTSLVTPQKHEILTVNSFQEVKDFKLNKGDTYDLLEPNSDILYIVEMDNIGKKKIRVFSLTEITEQYISNASPSFVTKEEYESLLQKLKDIETKIGGKNGTNESK